MKEIMKNIEAIRREKGVKQEVLAKMLGVRQNTYSQYVTRNEDIKFGKLSQIADKLGVTVVDIVVYPEKWVKESESVACDACKEKDKLIQQLTNYISLLEGKVTLVQKPKR